MTQLSERDWRDRVYGPSRRVVVKQWDNALLLYHLTLSCGHVKAYADTPKEWVRCRGCQR